MNAYNERRSDPENFGEGITRFGVVLAFYRGLGILRVEMPEGNGR
jgi:hypothetical protein